MNQLVTHRINIFMKKYESGVFDQDDVMLLLVDLRDTSHKNSLVRELEDFIAHPNERSKGLTWSVLDKAYKSIGSDFEETFNKGKQVPILTLCTENEIIQSVSDAIESAGVNSGELKELINNKKARDLMLCLVGLLTSFTINIGGKRQPLKLALSSSAPCLAVMARVEAKVGGKNISVNWNILETSCQVQDEQVRHIFPWGNLEHFVARRTDGGELAMCRLETDKNLT